MRERDYMGDKGEEIVPLPEKDDKTQNEIIPVVDGVGEETVFIAEYNPDQMARCVDEIYTTVLLLNKAGAWRNPYVGVGPEIEEEADEFFTYADAKEIFDLDDHPIIPESKATSEKGEKQSVSDERAMGEEGYYIPSVYPILEHIKSDEDHAEFRRIMSRYVAEKMPSKLQEFYGVLVAEVMNYALREFIRNKRIKGWEKFSAPTKEDIEYLGKIILQSLKERLGFRRGRRSGTTIIFQDEASFLAGLVRTLAKFPEEPSEPEAWEKFREDDALLDKNASFSAFRTWLERCKLDWATVIKEYWKPNRTAN
jgi:hypothetical protein